MKVTFENHIINLQFQSVAHIETYMDKQESTYGKMKVLQTDGTKVVAKYADAYGYVSARQSDRWSKKKMDLLIQCKLW